MEDFRQIIADALAKAPSNPLYEQAVQKSNELNAKLTDLDKRRNSLLTAMAQQNKKSQLTMKAEELLDGTVSEPDTDFRNELAEIHNQIAIVTTALQIHTGRMNDLQFKRSAEAGAALRATHQRMVQAMATALKALSAAVKQEDDFRHTFEMSNLSFSASGLRPMNFNESVRLDVEHSQANMWLAEAREYGYRV